METSPDLSARRIVSLNSPFRTAILVCVTVALCYLASIIGGALAMGPQMLSPLWPSCALLVSVLLLTPRRIWPILSVSVFATFAFYDVRSGVPSLSIVWLLLADAVEVLVAALCLSYSFGGAPRLDSVGALMKYSFFAVFLAPMAGAFAGAFATRESYWTNWRISFFSEALAYLTLVPAILGWISILPKLAQKSRAYYLEAAALSATLVLLGYLAFVAPENNNSPALLYSLAPVLLWSALRFGPAGVGTSMIVVACLSIRGALHGRGPFIGLEPLDRVLSLQLFLFVAAVPFMVLAAMVEERKQAEKGLRESEEKFRSVFSDASVGMAIVSLDGHFLASNQEFSQFIGYAEQELLGKSVQSVTHPEDWPTFSERLFRALTDRAGFQRVEKRCLHKNGQVLFGDCSASVICDIDGKPQYLVADVLDITERKRTEEVLSSVSRRLIEAQEQERARIARELHDDLSQRMALLQLGLSQLKQNLPSLSPLTKRELDKVAQTAREISLELRNLSHRLHPSKLDTLGLVASLEGFCREFSGQHNMQVQFVHRHVGGKIPKDMALCLFRIVQEALRNVAKHSGGTEAKVVLSGLEDRIDLCISDEGIGFEPASARGNFGLGLISMQERLRLVGGHLLVESEPSHGTRIHVRIPLSSTNRQARISRTSAMQ